jgi:hypothetical protein
VTLDKEITEVRCEELEDAVDSLRGQVGKLQDRADALESTNALYEKPPEEGGERTDVAFVQLENEVHRLSASLLTLVVFIWPQASPDS